MDISKMTKHFECGLLLHGNPKPRGFSINKHLQIHGSEIRGYNRSTQNGERSYTPI